MRTSPILADIKDVVVSSVQTGDVLKYNGTTWANDVITIPVVSDYYSTIYDLGNDLTSAYNNNNTELVIDPTNGFTQYGTILTAFAYNLRITFAPVTTGRRWCVRLIFAPDANGQFSSTTYRNWWNAENIIPLSPTDNTTVNDPENIGFECFTMDGGISWRVIRLQGAYVSSGA